ncbi:MAG: aspartate aminotransferase family protein [Nanoarchaeota archaeon]|nr:aspartate aminotransferase family protein [Nanoarchaeota archaeon]
MNSNKNKECKQEIKNVNKMDANKIKNLEKKHIMQNYARFNLVLESGKDVYVSDKNGKKYLDFIAGIACVPAGHSNKNVANAIINQAKKLIQVSNLYYTEPQAVLAEKLAKMAGSNGPKKSFFCNSGAEANESAIKLAKKITKKTDFIVCENAFHGRTHASLAATWKEKYKTPFMPLVEGFTFVKFDNAAEIKKNITKKTAAVIIEPIQGEAGVNIPKQGYLKQVSKICKDNKILLILDEVQTGNGRTGKFFAYQHEGIKPDIVTTAKGLANGVPIGVCMSDYEFDKGDHGSTFGGNCIASAAANATIDEIVGKNLMKNAEKIGKYFSSELKKIPRLKNVRGKGLMIGADILAMNGKSKIDAKKIVEKCIDHGLLINNTSETSLRFLPPLTITKKHVDEAIKILKIAIKESEANS